jgi:AraC-like DNA-binding protein
LGKSAINHTLSSHRCAGHLQPFPAARTVSAKLPWRLVLRHKLRQIESQESTSSNRLHVSTDDYPERDRLAIWQEVIGRSLFNVDIKSADDAAFQAEADILSIKDCAVSNIVSSQIQYSVAKDQHGHARDLINIIIVKRGRIRGRQRGLEVTIGPDQAFAVLANETGSVDLLEETEAFNLCLPISTIQPLVQDLGRTLARPLDHNPCALRLLDTYAGTLLSLDSPLCHNVAETATTHLTDLVGNVLGSLDDQTQTSETRGIRAARRQAIKEDIAANLTRHDLSPDEIAKRLGITPRYLRKLLQDDGTSFSDFLRHMRLQKAHHLLSDPRHNDRSISTIAYYVGFNDLSYFNRCFRRQFGVTPSDVREPANSRTGHAIAIERAMPGEINIFPQVA